MLGMRLYFRPRNPRTTVMLPVGLVMTAVMLSTSTGCSSVVTGTAVLAGPQIGQPVEWGPVSYTHLRAHET